MNERKEHWDKVFAESEDHALGWYQNDFSETMALLDSVPKDGKQQIFIAGAGTSALVEELLATAHGIIVNDISEVALKRLGQRLSQYDNVEFVCQDISDPLSPQLGQVDLWIDRAVLHFLTDDQDRESYVTNLKKSLHPGGFALFAEFSTKGAVQCAGLPVYQYDKAGLEGLLGKDFTCVSYHDFTYVNPYGDDRPYIYALFQRGLA